MFYDVFCFICFVGSKRYFMIKLYCLMFGLLIEKMIKNSEKNGILLIDNKMVVWCFCMCKNEFIIIVELMKMRRKEFLVEKLKFLVIIRKCMCVIDSRILFMVIGMVSVIIFIVCGLMIIGFDVRFVLYLCYCKCNKLF